MSVSSSNLKNNKSKLSKRIKKGFSKKLKIVPKIKLNVPEKLIRVERKKELFGP